MHTLLLLPAALLRPLAVERGKGLCGLEIGSGPWLRYAGRDRAGGRKSRNASALEMAEWPAVNCDVIQCRTSARFPGVGTRAFPEHELCLSSSAKVFFVSHGVPRSVSCYSARTTRTNHRRRRRPAGRRVRRPSDEASPSGRRLARHSSFSITSFSIEPAPPLGGQAAGANSRRCSFNCSLSTSMLRYRMASTQSS